jgi:hypothetical protein
MLVQRGFRLENTERQQRHRPAVSLPCLRIFVLVFCLSAFKRGPLPLLDKNHPSPTLS